MSTDTDSPIETPRADHPPSVNYTLDVLQAAGRPLTTAEIAERTHYARNTVSGALDELADEGVVATVDAPAVGHDHAGRPPRRYRLPR